MRQNIVVVNIPITKKGQQKFFQVSIPKDVHCIAGIATGISGLDGLNINEIAEKYQAGIIRIQAEHIADLCYSTEIFIGESILETEQPGFIDTIDNPVAGNGMQQVRINNSHTFYGCYVDTLGKIFSRNLSYTISLYLLTERKVQTEKANNDDTGTGK